MNNPYPIGTKVRGASCVGIPFEETVTEIIGPYTVKLDGLYVTPVSLISGVVQDDSPLGDEFAAQNIPENITAPASGQLSLL